MIAVIQRVSASSVKVEREIILSLLDMLILRSYGEIYKTEIV